MKPINLDHHDPRFTEATIPPVSLLALVNLAQNKGLAANHWFNGQGLSISQLNQANTLISFRQAITIIRRALGTLPSGAIGLQSGSRNALQTFGMLGFVLMSCHNIREVVALGIQHHQAAGSLMDIDVEISSDKIILSVFERFPEPDLLPFLSEEIFASIVTLARSLLEPSVAPLRIELSYAPPDYAAAYRELFKCPVHFNAGANRMIWDARYMEQPLASHNPASLEAALDVCRKLLEPVGNQKEVVASVERLLRENLRHRLGIVEIARKLNITERTLRRQLKVAGERFSDIRDRVMEQRARTLLSESTLSITEIALALGFNDSRDFRRAFRRWTGHPPISLRRLSIALDKTDN
ncbi:AraC family transcriptional regulator [Acinetobacter pittii]|uniref:AraC family transcriptional regulator n=1 Tax=Acinetobacter pittii TaxID=48296 RepID=UPI001EFE67CE|nr:AraC family transcriptional regulator [Acinetobacter pittii]MCG9491558.1 AraC family transcriptional regulator [Acinetobacter pittii]